MSRHLCCATALLVFCCSTKLLWAQDVIAPNFANIPYGPDARNVLDFWQAEGDGLRPLLVHIHGGGWTGGDKALETKFLKPYLEKGISVASINYRLTGEHPLPAPVYDAARAVQFLRNRAGEWRIDKQRIAATGTSAGACSSMWLLFHDDLADSKSDDPIQHESTRVCAAAAIAGQTSIDPKQIESWLGPNVLQHRMPYMAVGEKSMADALANYGLHEVQFKEFSPITHVDKNDPPLWMRYDEDGKLPCRDGGHGIHHPELGKKLLEKSKECGHTCYLVLKHEPSEAKYSTAESFLIAHLLAP
jgi:arylformamidase